MSNKLTYSWIAGIMGLMVASIMNNFGWKLTVLTNMLVFGGIIGLFISKITTDVIKKNYFYRIFSGPIITGVCVGVIGGIIFGGNPVEAGLALALLNVFWLLIPLFVFALIVYKENESFVTWFSLLFCIIFGTIDGGWLLDAEFGINRYSTTSFPLFIIPLFAFIGYITGKHSDKKADYEAKINQQYLQTVPGLFDTAKSLSSQANNLFQQKNYPSALQTYENALSHFTRAYEGAKALNDTDLANSISNNISAIQKNITACKNAIGADIASKARNKFEKGDFTGAIQTYSESLKYFQDAELTSKTKANIENCYIEIDTRKVEELSTQAVSLLKEAAALNEPFKAIEKLNQADNKLNEAVSLATKRKFTNALSHLNAISKDIRTRRDIVHDRLSNEAVISEKWDVEQVASKKSPTIQVAEQGNRLKALRESEFFNGFIRLRLSVSNKMSHTVTDVLLDIDLDENILRLDHYEPDTYAMRKGKILLGNISPNNDKTIAVYLDPLTCSKEGTDINCRIDYKDSYGKSDSIRMEPLKIPFTCPIFDTEQDINIGRLKELVGSLPAHGSRVFSLSRGVEILEAITLCREIIQMHDVRQVRTFKTGDGKKYETWYYGKTKVEKIDLIIKASVSKETESIEIFIAAPDQKILTGLLAQIGGNLTEKGKSLGKFAPQLNFTVKDSVVKGKRLLDLCDIYGNCGANVIMEDSVLY